MTADIVLLTDGLGLAVTPEGGAIWRFFARHRNGEIPLFRAPAPGESRPVLASACFPLVPFGNRVRNNRFRFGKRDWQLHPNTHADPHYLHGDGWLQQWRVTHVSKQEIVLDLMHRGPGTPYAYDAEQRFMLEGNVLAVALSVVNRGPVALPFGLGWHPYFPLTESTTLRAPARSCWDEDASFLPTVERPVPAELDFRRARGLPRRWVNSCFEGWNGQAEIIWPGHRAALAIDADPMFGRYVLFLSDPAFDPGYGYDYFCFEPMSHSVNAHHLPDGGGLKALEPGERLSGSVRYRYRVIEG